MKLCRQCNVEKELSSFYKHSKMLDGHLNKCKDCVKTRVSQHRELNIEKIKEYDKVRSKTEKRIATNKIYIQSDAGKETRRKASLVYKKRYPMKYAAHIIFRNSIRDKKIERKFICSICLSTKKIEGHHDDYTKPLDVRWLCEACHKEWHRHNKPIYE
jgi:hypothetical protein